MYRNTVVLLPPTSESPRWCTWASRGNLSGSSPGLKSGSDRGSDRGDQIIQLHITSQSGNHSNHITGGACLGAKSRSIKYLPTGSESLLARRGRRHVLFRALCMTLDKNSTSRIERFPPWSLPMDRIWLVSRVSACRKQNESTAQRSFFGRVMSHESGLA